MERFVVCVLNHLIVTEQQAVNTLGIQNRSIEGFERIVLYADCSLPASMEKFFLSIKIGNFGIDGDDSIGKLELAGQRIDKMILTYGDITASTSLEPSVAITAKQDSTTGSMIEEIVFYHNLLWGAEQGTTSTVVANGVVGKVYLRCPCKILNTIASLLGNFSRDRFLEADAESLGTIHALFRLLGNGIKGSDFQNLVRTINQFHCGRTHELYLVSLITPIKAIGLRVHVTAFKGVVIYTTYNLKICAMHVDGIIHHTFVESVHRSNLTLTTREMGSIGLSGEVACIVVALQANREAIQIKILTHLRQ